MTVRQRAVLRVLALSVGLALTGFIVWSLGLARVGEALRPAAPWLPLVLLFEVGIATTDMLAARTLLGTAARDVKPRTWLRASALAYAIGVVLPAGRAAGEAARAATLKDDVGLPRAAAACSRVQTAALFGTAAASLAGAAAAMSQSKALGLALAGNALLCTTLAAGLLSLIRWKRLSAFLAKIVRPAATDKTATSTTSALAKAILLCILGRGIQASQYGVVLHAVGGAATPHAALVVQGVHIVGATVGDAVPNQLGVTEGAYQVFAGAIGLASEPARAVSIALVVRAAQLLLASMGWGIALATARTRGR
jgi:uncharacterized membrane protein YbhN (UPF0104 family)